jgi:hypothetical protein
MPYRDEHTALQQRVEDLRREVSIVRAQVAELRSLTVHQRQLERDLESAAARLDAAGGGDTARGRTLAEELHAQRTRRVVAGASLTALGVLVAASAVYFGGAPRHVEALGAGPLVGPTAGVPIYARDSPPAIMKTTQLAEPGPPPPCTDCEPGPLEREDD